MNERIRELYLEAHSVREYPQDDPMRGGNPPTVYWQGEVSAEKFAELIISECTNITNSLIQHEGPGDSSIAEYIKEHFGV
jgi:uncharacterized protein YhfF